MKERELKKKCMGIVNQLFDLAEVPVEKRQEINDKADEYLLTQVKLLGIAGVSNSVVCDIEMLPKNCYYRDITMECKGCRNNANNCYKTFLAMAELFKTLEFKGIERDTIGKYAHPIEIEKGKYDWGGSSMPLLITTETTVRKLKQLYKGLDFDIVNLVPKKLIDIPTDIA